MYFFKRIYFIIVLIFAVLVLKVLSSKSELDESIENQKFCPLNCICDIFEGLHRADCSDQNLISTFADIPKEVEYLDISRNKISHINDYSFKGYSVIKVLDLSFNTISSLSLKSFESIESLQKLDLSYNRIDQFDHRLFEHNLKLTELDLSGNKFFSVTNQTFITSVSLKTLKLVDCKLVQVSNLMFHALPSLKYLDLSQNYLKVLQIKSFTSLKNLFEINLEDNIWQCDDQFHKILKWFKRREISVKQNQCYKPKKSEESFQKIIHVPTERPKTKIPLDILWNLTKNTIFPVDNSTEPINPYVILSNDCSTDDIDNIDEKCSIEVCKANLSELYQNCQVLKEKMKNLENNHLQAVISMCYVGIFFGALGGGLLVYLICFLRDRNIKRTFTEPLERQKLRKAYKNRSQYAHAQTGRTSDTQNNFSESENIRTVSPICPNRIPSFRNSIEPTVPRSLTPLRPSQSNENSTSHLYRRRQQQKNLEDQELPAILKYFRRSQRANERHPTRLSHNYRDDTYFLPSPTSRVPSQLQSVPSDPGHNNELITPQTISNAISNTSVIYNEIDELSQIPQDVCCTSHIQREIDALTVGLLNETAGSRASVTPPPAYIDVYVKAEARRGDGRNSQPDHHDPIPKPVPPPKNIAKNSDSNPTHHSNINPSAPAQPGWNVHNNQHPSGPPPAYPGLGHNPAPSHGMPPSYSPPGYSPYPQQGYSPYANQGGFQPMGYQPQSMGALPYQPQPNGMMGQMGQRSSGGLSVGSVLAGMAVGGMATSLVGGLVPRRHITEQHIHHYDHTDRDNSPQSAGDPNPQQPQEALSPLVTSTPVLLANADALPNESNQTPENVQVPPIEPIYTFNYAPAYIQLTEAPLTSDNSREANTTSLSSKESTTENSS
uniref:CSON000132 protein n=1 Tax=Culicoides sonorensis TaxID=179676 RepID=A0A336LQ60_CULSO